MKQILKKAVKQMSDSIQGLLKAFAKQPGCEGYKGDAKQIDSPTGKRVSSRRLADRGLLEARPVHLTLPAPIPTEASLNVANTKVLPPLP